MTATHDNSNCLQNLRSCICCVLFLGAIVGIVLAGVYGIPDRRYDISIDSVSGLDLPPSKDLPLNPQFNLTFRLASSSPGRRACMDAGTYVVVSYHCVPLATSAATPSQLCVGAKKSTTMPIVAKGTGVRMPGYMTDSLAADLRNGVEAFEVAFKLSSDNSGDVAWCGVRRVGDVAAECGQRNTCPQSQEHTSSPLIIITPPIITD